MIAVVNSRGLSDADYSQTSEEMAFQNDVRKANSQATTNAYLGFFGTLLAHILFYVPQVQLAFSNTILDALALIAPDQARAVQGAFSTTILDAASGLVFGLVPFFAFKKKSLVRAVLALFVSGLMGSLMGRLIGFTTALVFYIYGRKKFDPVLP